MIQEINHNEVFAGRFSQIVEVFKKKLNTKKEDFAKMLNMNSSTIYRYANGDIPASVGLIEKLLNLNVNPYFLISGELPILLDEPTDMRFEDVYKKMIGVTTLPNSLIGANIYVPLVNITAQAGNANFIQDEKESFDKVRVPKNIKAKVDYAFEVEGDSMYPIITHEALAFCKQVNVAEEVRFGVTKIAKKIYVVSTNNQLLIKYLVRDSDGNLFLESANKDYDNVQIDISEINLLFRVEAALNVF